MSLAAREFEAAVLNPCESVSEPEACCHYSSFQSQIIWNDLSFEVCDTAPHLRIWTDFNLKGLSLPLN